MMEREPTEEVDALTHELAELRREKAALELSEYERRQAEDALQRSEDKYRRLAEGLRRVCFFFACQPDGEITYVSPSATDILGHEPREMLGGLAGLLAEDSGVNDNALSDFETLFGGESNDPVLLEFRHADGGSRLLQLVDVSARQEGGPREGIAIDVTKRLRAETAILQSRERFRRLAEALRDEYLFYERDRNGNLTRVSGTVRDLLGYDAEDFRDNIDDYLTDSPLNQDAERALMRALDGRPSEPYEIELRDAEGRARLLEVCDLPRIDATGQVTAVDGLARDLSERRRVEEALEWQVEADALALRNSTLLMDATDDGVLDGVLESLGRFLEVDRVWLAHRQAEIGLALEHTWTEEDAEEEQRPALPFFPEGGSHRRLEAGEPVGIPRVDGLSGEAEQERQSLEGRDVDAALWIPVVRDGALDSVLGIESIRGARAWTDRETRLGQRMAHALAETRRRLAAGRELEDARRETARLRGERDEEVDRRTAEVRTDLTRQLIEAKEDGARRVQEVRAALEEQVETAGREAREKLNRLREEADRELARVRADAERRRAEAEERAEERERQQREEAEERIQQLEDDADERVRRAEEEAEGRIQRAREEADERIHQAQEEADERARRAEREAEESMRRLDEETQGRVREAEEELERVRAESREALEERIEEARSAAELARQEAEERAARAAEEATAAEERARRAVEEREDAERRASDVDAEVERRLAEARADLEEEIETARHEAVSARAEAADAEARARADLRRPLEVLERIGSEGAPVSAPVVQSIVGQLRQLVEPTEAADQEEPTAEIQLHSLVEDLAAVVRLWAADRPVEVTVAPSERAVVLEGRPSFLRVALTGLVTSLVDLAQGGTIALGLEVDESRPAVELRATVDRMAAGTDDELPVVLEPLWDRLVAAGGRLQFAPADEVTGEADGESDDRRIDASERVRLEMTLPVEDVRGGDQAPIPDTLDGRRILVVDDHRDSRKVLARALESGGMEVQTASSGPAALQMFSEAARRDDVAPWDLMLIDWAMPGMDGIETTSRVQQHSGLPVPPAVLMGNPCEAEDVHRRAELGGFAGALTKPAPASTLVEVLARVLSADVRDGGSAETAPGSGIGSGPKAASPQPTEADHGPPAAARSSDPTTATRVDDELAFPSADDPVEPDPVRDLSSGSLARALDDLAAALSARKPSRCQPIIRRIKLETWPPGLRDEMERLLGLVERYHFRRAEEMVETLQHKLGS